MINLNLNNNVTISQTRTVQECNSGLVIDNDIKQSKIENFIDTKKVELDKQSIIQLQEHIEVKETKLSVIEQHPIDLIKGRDDKLYNRYMLRMSIGKELMLEFKEIVERNKDNKVINNKDWQRVEEIVQRFQGGVKENISDLSETTDSIIRHALSLSNKGTQNRLDTLKEYLSTKTKSPEESKVEVVTDTMTLSVAHSEKDTYTSDLLKWINNCLKQYDKVLNKKYNSAFLQIVELSYSQELIQFSC